MPERPIFQARAETNTFRNSKHEYLWEGFYTFKIAASRLHFMEFNITCRDFNALTPHELYAILRLRSEVFVVEQQCIFLDADNIDQLCEHVMVCDSNGELVGCTRLVPPGVTFEEMSVGRVVTHPSVRKKGVGRLVMNESISLLYTLYGKRPIKIGAQHYLKHFYESFGFRQAGEIYDEDGIDHIHMVKPA